MATKILTFNPLDEDEVDKAERELERLLNRGWKIVSSIGGNRPGRQGGQVGQGGRGPLRNEREVAASAPVSKDYVVLILHQRVARSSPQPIPSENNISDLDALPVVQP
jgi:hypothetical protein